MPAVNIFETLRAKVMQNGAMVPQEKRAMFWFRDYMTELSRWQRQHEHLSFQQLQNRKFTKQVVSSNGAQPGFLYYYLYDPKWKAELPYYDKFPFTLVLERGQGRFLGLNFHYLDYYNRALLFDALYDLRIGRNPSINEDRSDVRDIRMRIRATYDLLKGVKRYRAFRPCIKEYLVPHVRSPLLKVGAAEWDVALFLPVEQFEKRTKRFVWEQSRKQF
jgi:hypothetical protein